MKFTRRTLQSAAALTLLGALAATPAFAQDKPKVALVMKSLANEFFRTMEDGAKAHQKAHAASTRWWPTASRTRPTPPPRSRWSSRWWRRRSTRW
jgi:ABC-type sugar transport system substrate-binding protein